MKQVTLFLLLLITSSIGWANKSTSNNLKISNKSNDKTYFYKDGVISIQKWYGEDKKIDSVKTYYKTGEINEVFYYKNGRLNGECFQYGNIDGEKKVTWFFNEGKLEKRIDHFLSSSKKNEAQIKEFHKKLEAINKRIKEGERKRSLYYGRARLRRRLGNDFLALNGFLKIKRRYEQERYKSKMPNKFYGNLYDHLGSLFAGYEMENKAIHYKFLAVKVNPEQTRLLYNLGAYLKNIKEFSLANEFFDEVLEVWPKHAFTHRALAAMHSDLENFEKAKKHIDIAYKQEAHLLKLGSGFLDQDIRTLRGLIYHKLGDSKKGISDLKEAIHLQKNNSFAYRNLGIVYFDLKRYSKACEMFNISKELNYEKIHDRKDLDKYIDLSCNNTRQEKQIVSIDKEKLFIFPNPVEHIGTVANVNKGNFDYEIYSFESKLIRKGKAMNYTFDASGLSAGLYVLKVQEANNIHSSIRFIKE